MLDILWMIIAGAVIGAIARVFMKGDEGMGIIWTIILGAAGYGIAGWIAGALGVGTVLRWIIGAVVAVLLIGVFLASQGKSNSLTK